MEKLTKRMEMVTLAFFVKETIIVTEIKNGQLDRQEFENSYDDIWNFVYDTFLEYWKIEPNMSEAITMCRECKRIHNHFVDKMLIS